MVDRSACDQENDNGPVTEATGPMYYAERVGFEPTDHFEVVPALAVRSDRPDSGTSPGEQGDYRPRRAGHTAA